MERVEDLVWALFERTGEVGLYLMYNDLCEDAKLEMTESESEVTSVRITNVLCAEREM